MSRYKISCFPGMYFDDLVVDDYYNTWTQVCELCKKELDLYNINKGSKYYYVTRYGEGKGFCGVEGCNNNAEHYIDFDDEVIFSEV